MSVAVKLVLLALAACAPKPREHPSAAFVATVPAVAGPQFKRAVSDFAGNNRFLYTDMALPPHEGQVDDGLLIHLIRHDRQIVVDTSFEPGKYDVAIYKAEGRLAASDEEIRASAVGLVRAMTQVPGVTVTEVSKTRPAGRPY